MLLNAALIGDPIPDTDLDETIGYEQDLDETIGYEQDLDETIGYEHEDSTDWD